MKLGFFLACPIAPLFALSCLTNSWADPSPKSPSLSLERIHDKEDLKEKRFTLKWLDDGDRYTFLKKSTQEKYKDSKEIWLATATDPDDCKILVSAADLVAKEAETPLQIDGYDFFPDHSLLLIFTNSERVWRSNSRGDYWVYNLQDKTLKKLGGPGAEPSSLLFAKPSPRGTHVAYVRENHIHMESLKDHSIRTLTTSTNNQTFNGRFDWVYEEELGIRDGFRWSPDGSAIAY